MTRRKITEEVKQKVVAAQANGLSRKKIAEQYGISVSSVGRILKEKGTEKPAKPAPGKAPEKPAEPKSTPEMDQKLAEIERRIAQLEKKILYYEAMKQGRGVGPLAELFSPKKADL
jgi:transposase